MIPAIVIGLFGCVAALDYWPKRKKRTSGENFFYVTVWMIAFAMTFLYSYNIIILSPTGVIKGAVEGLIGYFS